MWSIHDIGVVAAQLVRMVRSVYALAKGSEEGLLYEYAYATEHKTGGGSVSFRGLKRETGMESTLISYQD